MLRSMTSKHGDGHGTGKNQQTNCDLAWGPWGAVCYSLWLPRLGNPGKTRLWPKLVSLKDRGLQEVPRALAVRVT